MILASPVAPSEWWLSEADIEMLSEANIEIEMAVGGKEVDAPETGTHGDVTPARKRWRTYPVLALALWALVLWLWCA